MEKFVPYEKLSKKKKKELNSLKRKDWNGVNPVTRRSENPKAYNRRKSGKYDNYNFPDFYIFNYSSEAVS